MVSVIIPLCFLIPIFPYGSWKYEAVVVSSGMTFVLSFMKMSVYLHVPAVKWGSILGRGGIFLFAARPRPSLESIHPSIQWGLEREAEHPATNWCRGIESVALYFHATLKPS